MGSALGLFAPPKTPSLSICGAALETKYEKTPKSILSGLLKAFFD